MIQLKGTLLWEENIMNKILVVEDDEAIANLLYMNLKKAGYYCKVANDGKTAADMLEEEKFDLGIFDIMIPELDGYELQEYAAALSVPVIFLTAKGTTMDKVKGLKAGAEDYITKPFEILELLARIENVFRRYHKIKTHYSIKDLEIDVASREVKKNGKIIELTCKEFDLLLLFIKNPNIALYRSLIYEEVWAPCMEVVGDISAPVAANSTRFHSPSCIHFIMCPASTLAEQPQPEPPAWVS